MATNKAPAVSLRRRHEPPSVASQDELSHSSELVIVNKDPAPTDWDGLELLPQHREVLTSRGITPEVAAARGVSSAHSNPQLEELGFVNAQRRVPALVIPIHNTVGDVVTHQIRPDNPRQREKKPLKYELPTGAPLALDVPPAIRSQLTDSSVPLVITEGPLKADAAVSHGMVCVAVLGVWNFARNKELLNDWENVVLKDRTVAICFDSDVMTNPSVYSALQRMHGFLTKRHAQVMLIYLPPGANGEKVGLDDFLAAGHTAEDVWTLAEPELRLFDTFTEVAAPYRQDRTGIYWDRMIGEATESKRLTNFAAKIEADTTVDDGTETTRRLDIVALVGGRTERMTVSAAEFPGLSWVPQLGPQAIINPGISSKDHTRAAIQYFSSNAPRRRIYTHTGWREIEGRPVYLTASGGIDRDGLMSDVHVELDGAAALFELPPPPYGDERITAVRASLDLLAVAPERITVPLLGAVSRAPLPGTAPVSLHLYGRTGAGKTALAAVCQQHHGSGLNASALPAHWESTPNALEGSLHQFKDVLCVIDEYVSAATPAGQAKLQEKAERVFRGVANHTGRQRMRADGSLRPSKPPRALVISTGEDRPAGESLAARRIDIAVQHDDIDFDRLTACQRRGADGVYASTMAAYVQWIAVRYTELEKKLEGLRRDLREQVRASGQHRRTPDAVAELALGISYFLSFAVDVGAIDEAERDAFWSRCWTALLGIGAEQMALQQEHEPVERYFDLLRSALASGAAHVADKDGCEPASSLGWGWRRDDGEAHAQGERIGWIDGDNLFLDSHTAYTAVRARARAGDEVYPLREGELRRQLFATNRLASREQERGRFTVRHMLEGQRRAVLHLHATRIYPSASPADEMAQLAQLAHTLTDSAPMLKIVGQSSGPVGGTDGAKWPTDVTQEGPKTGTGPPVAPALGQLGHLGQSSEGEGSVCAYRGHTETWRAVDGRRICCLCHPRPVKSPAM